MDRFELTEEQRQQAKRAREEGKTGVIITCTPEQDEYMRRAHEEEDAAYLVEQMRVRIRKLEDKVTRMEAELAELKGAK
jgi:hypothetical protein